MNSMVISCYAENMLQIPRKSEKVTYTGLASALEAAGPAIMDFFARKGLQCLVLSAFDGEHSKHSAHYKGRALDFRSRGVKAPQAFCMDFHKALQAVAVDGSFFVVWEGNRVHLEWCPPYEIPTIVGYRPGKFFYDATPDKKILTPEILSC